MVSYKHFLFFIIIFASLFLDCDHSLLESSKLTENMSKYSRIRRANTTRLSNSMDFSDQSFPFQKHNSSSEHSSTSEIPIREDKHGVKDDVGEVFGEILGRKFPTSDSAFCNFMAEKENIKLQRSAKKSNSAFSKLMAEKESIKLQRSVKKSFSMRRRSISFSEEYSRIHDQDDISVEGEKGDADNTLPARPPKKKGNFLTTWKQFFRF